MTTIDGVEKRLTLADVEEKIRETESSLIGLKRAKELLTNT